MTRTHLAVCLVMLFAGGDLAAAQTISAPKSQATEQRAQPEYNVVRVTLGQATALLYGPWKFTVGDSPTDAKTGKPLWAEPDFDDSKWETVDLTPQDESKDPSFGISGYVPGWTAKGHPGYWGYAWYRIRVQVRARPGEAMALAGPVDVDDAYQLFDNGELVGQFGDFTGRKPQIYYSQPRMFSLAPQGSHGDEAGRDGAGSDGTGLAESTRVLAFRMWMEPVTLLIWPDTGGLHNAPVLGEAGTVAASYQIHWLGVIRAMTYSVAEALLFGLLAVVAFSLILFDRSDRVYLWMGALFLLIAADAAIAVIGGWTELLSLDNKILLADGFVRPWIYGAWVMVWRVWFGQRRPAWLPWLTAGLTLLLMVSNVLRGEVFFGLVPHAVAVHFATVSYGLQVLLFSLLVWVVVEGIRRQGVEAWLVLPVVALRGIPVFSTQVTVLHTSILWHVLGVSVAFVNISSLLAAALIALLLLRRLLKSVRRQRLMALDVKQAQEVQQVILPEARLALNGLIIESEYRPAREVGGDFFQIIPHKTDGSVLIVVGDVVGKGLKAGMLVALLVGAIRTAAETNDEPGALLSTLNRRLLGRGDAQATCLALRIEADGAVTLANSGHMAPYLNGEAVAMEGALPLGMFEGAESSMMHFRLKDGDKLMLMSDGVAEATDPNGRLFGFERVDELVRTAATAAEVAGAAQAFGQEDDISVVSVTRTTAKELAAAQGSRRAAAMGVLESRQT